MLHFCFWCRQSSYSQILTLITIDTNIKQLYQKKRKNVFVLDYFKFYVILADIGNEHSSRYVLPLHLITFVIRK